MTEDLNIRVGRSSTVHVGVSVDGHLFTSCGAEVRMRSNGGVGASRVEVTTDPVTCKSCLRPSRRRQARDRVELHNGSTGRYRHAGSRRCTCGHTMDEHAALTARPPCFECGCEAFTPEVQS